MKVLCQTRRLESCLSRVLFQLSLLAAFVASSSSAHMHLKAPKNTRRQLFSRIKTFESMGKHYSTDDGPALSTRSSSTASISPLRKRKLDNIFANEGPSSTDTTNIAASEFNKNNSNDNPRDGENEATIDPQNEQQKQDFGDSSSSNNNNNSSNSSNARSKKEILLSTKLIPALCFGVAGLSLTGLIVWCFALGVRKRRKQATHQFMQRHAGPSSPLRAIIDEDIMLGELSSSSPAFAIETIQVQQLDNDDASSVSSLWTSYSQRGQLNYYVTPNHQNDTTGKATHQRDGVPPEDDDDDDDDWRQELREVVTNSFHSTADSVSPLTKDGSNSSTGGRTSVIRRRGPLVVGQTVDADREVCWAAALGGTRIYVALAAVDTLSQESVAANNKNECATNIDATTPPKPSPCTVRENFSGEDATRKDKNKVIAVEEQPKHRGRNVISSPNTTTLCDEDSDTSLDDVSPVRRDPETATGMTMVTGRLDTESCLIDRDLETAISPYNTYLYKDNQVDSLYSYIRRLQRFVTGGPTNDDNGQNTTWEKSHGGNASPKRLFSPVSTEAGDTAIRACTSLLIGQLSADNKVCIGENPGVSEHEYALASNRYIQDVRDAVTKFLREGPFLENWS